MCGASIAAASAVWRGEAEHAFNASGGLHHAMPERASGFCVYDDPAVAIAWLLADGRRADRLRRRGRASRRRRRRRSSGTTRACSPSRSTSTSRRSSSPGRAGCRSGVGRTRPAARSTCRCHVAPATRRGWMPCARSCRASSPSSRPTCSSPSSAATRTTRTRWPSCGSRRAPTGRPPRRCTSWRTRSRAADGSRPAGAAIAGLTSCPAPGRSRSPRWPGSPATCRTSSRRRGWIGRAIVPVSRCPRRSRNRRSRCTRPTTRRRRVAAAVSDILWG